jgi:hypothetical protein
MKAPIILDEHGDVMVFETVDHAQRAVEPIDVANGEYVAYDSAGRLLAVEVSPSDQQIVIREAESEAKHSEKLRTTLMRFLLRAGVTDDIAGLTTDKLIALLVSRFGYTR